MAWDETREQVRVAGKAVSGYRISSWEAYRRVKENEGAPGADRQSLEDFESDLRNNLYKIWNRLSSGTYFPPPVRGGNSSAAWRGENPRGANCGSRVAQKVAALAPEARAE